MGKSEEIKQSVCIAFLFTIVTCVLDAIYLICSIIVRGDFKHLGGLLSYPNLCLIVTIVIIAALTIIIKKYYQENLSSVIKEPVVLLITGIITGLQGIISASIIPAHISSISSNIDMLKQYGEQSAISKSILSSSLSILMVLIQIVIAVCLILFYRKLSHKNNQDLSLELPQ